MTLVLLIVIIAAAHLVETTTGFGATVLAVSLGAHLVPLEALVPALVLLAWLQSLWILVRSARHIRWRLLLTRILPPVGLGLIAGAVVFRVLGSAGLKLVLGGFVVFVAGLELVRLIFRKTEPRPLPRPAGVAVLLGGGVFHGMFASGGPLVVYYTSRQVPDKRAFRATLAVLWLSLNTVLAASFAVTGGLNAETARLAGTLVPALAGGIVVGELLHEKVNETIFRTLVQIVLLGVGVSLLI